MENKVFKEVQGFGTWWLYVLLFGLLGYHIFEIIQTYLHTGFFRLDIAFYILLFVTVSLLLMRLHTKVDATGIEITFIPFAYKKKWTWDMLDKAYIRTYGLADFGGWGYRIGSQGKAYNTKGKEGLQLEFKNYDRVMIGTQKSEELGLFVSQFINNTDV